MAKRIILDVVTPPGDRVILTRDRWLEIVRYKHPALAGHQDELGECLRDPDAIRGSAKDPEVHLYYRVADRGHICAVIGGEDRQQRFVIAAYFTQSLKAGRELWTR